MKSSASLIKSEIDRWRQKRSDKERKIDSPEGRNSELVAIGATALLSLCAIVPLCHPWSKCNLHYATNPHCLNVSFCFMPDDVENEQNTTEKSKHFASLGHRELWINPAANITLSVISSAISGLEHMTPRAGIKCKTKNYWNCATALLTTILA